MTHQHVAVAPDGTDIAWSRSGTGPPVVLVHGITESARSFDPVAERLAEHFEVVTLDLRGHGESALAADYGLGAMASDVISVVTTATIDPPHLVGHSLGGAVVTAAGSAMRVASIIDIDQSLQLGAFKEQLVPVEPMLRDPDQFPGVIEMLFESMSGDLLPTSERRRISELRVADQDVVLGVWELLLTESVDNIASSVDAALAGYRTSDKPYLALFGIDPGDGYGEWLSERIPASTVEVWPEYGHYPHLVDPDRFVERATAFWNDRGR